MLAIIPARYASTRFPAKPLAVLGRKCIIEWVYDAAKAAFNDVVVATDDQRIKSHVESFGGHVVMTSTEHRCGTERCAEALDVVGSEWDVVINVQGDEPFVTVDQLRGVVAMFEDASIDIATLAMPIKAEKGSEELFNPNVVKVVINERGRAMYFSRWPIPYQRDVDASQWLDHHRYYRHLGLYAFRPEVLRKITQLPMSSLERAESLEQLRWLEAGYSIGVALTDEETVGIDTPEDLRRAEELLATDK